ncbi:hypothetical protein BD779DRAFT_1678428 [Infundibulicybe gibba]|nr:hypothetical protein BD779DRAFT_1678428 [Infundibulicybe gibba]
MADNSAGPASTSRPQAVLTPPIPCNLPAPNNYALHLLNPFMAHTRMVKNYILMLAIFATVANEHKEAAWYGPWTIVLDLLFMDTHIMPNGVCYPIPQMSVSFNYDPTQYDEDGSGDSDDGYNINDGENRSDDDPFKDKHQSINKLWPLDGRGLSPSPGRISSAAPIATPPITPPNKSPYHDLPPSKNTARLVPKIGHDTNNLLFQASRLILIVEIKGMGSEKIDWIMERAEEQVISQASHAFRADNTYRTRVYYCCWHYWTYFECTRKDMSPFSTASEHDDPSYRADSRKQPQALVHPQVPEKSYLSLQDNQGLSNLAFGRIYRRLKARIDAV